MKHPSAEWSKSPETLIGWHLTIIDPTDRVVKSVLLLFLAAFAYIWEATVFVT